MATVLSRRLVTFPAVLAGFAAGALLLPLVGPLAVLADLARGRVRLPLLRALLMGLCWLAMDIVAMVCGAGLWLAFGGGRWFGTARSIRIHGRFQTWWLGTVARIARPLLGVRFEVEHEGPLHPGPVIVICRHASYGDAILPALLFGTWDSFQLRHVLMRETSFDPALDLFGHRLPNHFVERSAANPAAAAAEVEAITALARGLAAHEVAVIFPEGQFFTATRRDRAIASVRRRDPERAERVNKLRHVLPPRPGGCLALLDGAPVADVVVVAHVGFEATTDLASILRNAPLRQPVQVRTWRIPRSQIPTGEAARLRWLDDTWASVDAWVHAVRGALTDRAPSSFGPSTRPTAHPAPTAPTAPLCSEDLRARRRRPGACRAHGRADRPAYRRVPAGHGQSRMARLSSPRTGARRHHRPLRRRVGTRAEMLVFVYPTRWFGLPAQLKGWLDRVLVPSVAFDLDPTSHRVKGKLGHIRHLVAITTHDSTWPRVKVHGDAGRRTLLWTLRLVCGQRCRSTWLALYDVDRATDHRRRAFVADIERCLERPAPLWTTIRPQRHLPRRTVGRRLHGAAHGKRSAAAGRGFPGPRPPSPCRARWLMRALVVYAHPDEDSFVARLRRTVVTGLERAGHDVDVADLVAERFDPLPCSSAATTLDPTVGDYAARLAAAQALVFVHPTWWGGQPALVKGWMDRVLCNGVAYTTNAGRVQPALGHIEHLAVVCTHGSPRWINLLQGEPGRRIATAGLAGFVHPRARVRWLAIYGLDRDDPAARERFVQRVHSCFGQW